MALWSIRSCIRGYYVYRAMWAPIWAPTLCLSLLIYCEARKFGVNYIWRNDTDPVKLKFVNFLVWRFCHVLQLIVIANECACVISGVSLCTCLVFSSKNDGILYN